MINPFNNQGMCCVGEVSHPQINDGRPLPLFEPASPSNRPSINAVEGWNAAAEKANSRAFFQVFGRYPTCNAELMAWEDSHFSKNFARSVRK